ncbi:hypothetical protein MTP99_010140 [Tenebrio molitor]|jgi:hypothetical protein|nr:hypothetical protein MTP99_010140 [Tenebrio molitor]
MSMFNPATAKTETLSSVTSEWVVGKDSPNPDGGVEPEEFSRRNGKIMFALADKSEKMRRAADMNCV